MCRLLAYASRTPVTLTELLGEQELAAFTALSRKHADGWGFAWGERAGETGGTGGTGGTEQGDEPRNERDGGQEDAASSGGVRTLRSADPAHASPEFARVSQEHRTDLALAHVRWATAGLPIRIENTHPFGDGTLAIAHNGAITPPEALDALLTPELAAERRGTTDSERYALAVLGAAREVGPAAALAQTAAAIAARFDYSSVNAIAITPEQLVAVSRYRPEAEAAEEEHEYYHLRYRVTPDAVIVASSGWGDGWQTLGNGELLVVQRGTLAVEIVPVGEPTALH